MDTASDDAFVLGLVPYGEADLVVRLLGRARGRVSAFARGARSSKRRFAGGLSPLSFGRAELRPRRGTELLALEAFEPDGRFFGLSEEPGRYGRAAYLAEVTERLVPEEEPVPALFDLLVVALARLSSGHADARLLRGYELKLLEETGYLPDLTSATDAPDEAPLLLDTRSGALVAHDKPGTVPFPPRAQEAALALLTAPLDEPPVVEGEVLREVARLFACHLRLMDIRDLRSVAFLRSIESGKGS